MGSHPAAGGRSGFLVLDKRILKNKEKEKKFKLNLIFK